MVPIVISLRQKSVTLTIGFIMITGAFLYSHGVVRAQREMPPATTTPQIIMPPTLDPAIATTGAFSETLGIETSEPSTVPSVMPITATAVSDTPTPSAVPSETLIVGTPTPTPTTTTKPTTTRTPIEPTLTSTPISAPPLEASPTLAETAEPASLPAEPGSDSPRPGESEPNPDWLRTTLWRDRQGQLEATVFFLTLTQSISILALLLLLKTTRDLNQQRLVEETAAPHDKQKLGPPAPSVQKRKKQNKEKRPVRTPAPRIPAKSPPSPPEPARSVQQSATAVSIQSGWLVVGGSVAGASHVKGGIPLQDSFRIKMLDDEWGIAVVADGAGSRKYSDQGAALIARKFAPHAFEQLIEREGWRASGQLPLAAEWAQLATDTLRDIKRALELEAKNREFNISLFGSTVITVIFSPHGLLVTHVGDGRAAYSNADNDWFSMMLPLRGEEANATRFITGLDFRDPSLCIEHEKVEEQDAFFTRPAADTFSWYVESRVVNEPVTAFSLMSDGCEKAAFVSSQMRDDHMWVDPNEPYPPFFTNLTAQLKEMHNDGLDQTQIEAIWQTFLREGNEVLQRESDDKTMILGIRL